MSGFKKKRVVYWKYEYRERDRPHILVAADPEMSQVLKLNLQSNWLVTLAEDMEQAHKLASIVPPSRILIDSSVANGSLLIERLKRERETHCCPILWLARGVDVSEKGIKSGAQNSLIIGPVITEKDVELINSSLRLLRNDSFENLRLVGVD